MSPMSEEEYAELFNRIRPEIIELAQKNQHMWEYGEKPTETNLFHLRTGADLVSVEVGFCLAGDA